MQRNSKQHIIDRFKEKFYGTISFKDKEPFELTKEDYDSIHHICKDDTIGYNLQMSPREKGSAGAYGDVYSMDWTADDACMTKEEWDVIKSKPRTLILYPIN